MPSNSFVIAFPEILGPTIEKIVLNKIANMNTRIKLTLCGFK